MILPSFLVHLLLSTVLVSLASGQTRRPTTVEHHQGVNSQLVVLGKEVFDIGKDVTSLLSKQDSQEAELSALKSTVDEIKMAVQGGEAQCHVTKKRAHNCQDILENGGKDSGVYNITVVDPRYGHGPQRIEVYCDQDTEGGGWMVFQRRQDGTVNFFRNWADYAQGFGRPDAEFWMGNELLWKLTSQDKMELRFDLGDFEDEYRYAKYSTFSVASVANKFKLEVSGYSGDAGDAFSGHNGMSFSTKDSDNDIHATSCAVTYKGGWWYQKCHWSNINGRYLSGQNSSYADGVNWQLWHGYHYSLKFTEMKMRPKKSGC